MHYATQTSCGPMLIKHFEQIVPCVSCFICATAVDEDGAFALGRDQKLSNKPFLLNGMSSSLVVIVEPDLPAGDHLWLSQQTIQLCQGSFVSFGRIVWIDTGAGVKSGHPGLAVVFAAYFKSPVHLRRALADANREYRANSRLCCSAKHLFAVFVVTRTIEMRVRINQQAGYSLFQVCEPLQLESRGHTER